ncbi:MAG TPA: enoyl-CoA hydratase-related protein [Puia sp.]|jgi:enoyl-CoA hydratase|nr:enoyl-CoA hydratase-related protein [Puia sp.]
MYKTLLTDLTDNILTVTINRPDKLNALNKTVISELGEVVEEIYANKDVRSAILTGAGQKAFVAGADIAEFQGLGKEEGRALSAKGSDIFFRIASCPKPVVAAINGFALGGGCELAMACHIRLCVAKAKFGQPEVNLGLIPGYGGTQRLTKLIGRGRAIEIMLTGRMVEATEAHTMGLVNYVVEEADELLTETRKLLSIINEKAPLAIARIIECANIAAGDGIVHSETWDPDPFGGNDSEDAPVNGFVREQEAFGECFGTADMQEGTAAFLEKRKPRFRGA